MPAVLNLPASELTVKVRAHNTNQIGGAAIDPASATFRVSVFGF